MYLYIGICISVTDSLLICLHLSLHGPKMESTLCVPSKLTFSDYLRCLNFPLWIIWPAIAKQVEESLFWDTAPTSSTKFKHLKFSENVNFEVVLIPF